MAILGTTLLRAIRNEMDIARNGIAQLRELKDKMIVTRDGLQTDLDSVKERIAQLNIEITDAQSLIDDLQAEVASVQARNI